jgi:CheY-like chemotaxis protein
MLEIPSIPRAAFRRNRIQSLIMGAARQLILLALVFCWVQPGLVADNYSPDENRSSREAPVVDAGAKTPDFNSALKSQLHETVPGPEFVPPTPDEPTSPLALELLALCGLVCVLFILRIIRFLHKGPEALQPVSGIELFSNLLAEDEAFGNFMSAMKDGPAMKEDPAAAAPEISAAKKSGPLEQFFEEAPKRIAMARKIFSEIGRAIDAGLRQKILEQVSREVGWLKDSSGLPELLPAWQTAAALEGLLKQLTRNVSNVTPSALRTAAAALDLLQDLCIPGIKPNLTKKPPVRLLVVDDDAISRNAVSLALRKIFPEPELAEGGEAALALAAKHTYDVIFLDVEMPGMDGFESCSQIHDLDRNRSTPVVFVTRHADFDARAKSTLSGGEDLIGKPFLAFEITVKALTLVLRGRLQRKGAALPSAGIPRSRRAASIEPFKAKGPPAAAPSTVPSSPIAKPLQAVASEAECGRPPSQHAVAMPLQAEKNGGQNQAPARKPADGTISPATRHSPLDTATPPVSLDTRHPTPDTPSFDPSPADFARAFFTHAPAHLEELRNQLQTARNAALPAGLEEFMGELYVGVHSLTSDAERAEMRAVHRLASTLEGMLKKLLEQPKLCIPSTLDTAAAALELLEKLCRAGSNPDLANPPIRILVVDDDPLALRVIGGSVQLVLGRPDSADSGERALTLATEKAFDLIFLDVLMPGIDGFTACSKIHETALNRLTPVVFVTSHSDQESRSRAAASGGCGFIPKPVLSSQITLTALTFILGSRLGTLKPALVAAQVEEAVS